MQGLHLLTANFDLCRFLELGRFSLGKDTMPEMELLALLAISLMAIIGWIVAKIFFGKWIDPAERFYFAPAVGMGLCAVIAYLATVTRQTAWYISIFTLAAFAVFLWDIFKKQSRPGLDSDSWRLLRVSAVTLLCLYGMQISLFHLFKGIYPGSHEVWHVFKLSGVSPPDQMFAWHQAMFADLHRQYPQDPFYGEMDFYDRPHLGGYLTLFFFKLFYLSLTEDHFVYPAPALRFYHCFWWLLNNLYLLGIAPLFRRLFGYRGAALAIASTALSGFILLSNSGGWVKFAAFYPLLLAFLLFLEGKAPLLQAVLCAASFYLHGSVLPFLLGFGLLQILSLYYPIRPDLARVKDVAWFAAGGIVLVGAWFVTVRWMGSKQPLFHYYLYGAGLSDAQTKPVAEIAKAFYAKHSWASLSLFPLENLINGIWPVHLLAFVKQLFSSTHSTLSDFGSLIFDSQRFWVLAAAGLTAVPFVLVGAIRILSKRYAGRTILALYLIPTLLMALVYRIEWSFSLHIMCLYHAFVLFLWVSVVNKMRLLVAGLGLSAIALEGAICVLFADVRFLPVQGIRLRELTIAGWTYLGAYLGLLLAIIAVALLELRRLPEEDTTAAFAPDHLSIAARWKAAGGKLLIGLLVTFLTIAAYSMYCLRFY